MTTLKAIRPLANLVALAATVAVNALAVALPLNGQDTGAIAERFQVYFLPAGYVFSIWSLIYLLLGAFVLYQALPGQRANPEMDRVGWVFVVSCLANVAWIFSWHYLRFGLSLVAMAVLLLSLVAIYVRLDIGRRRVSTLDRWLIHLPFQVYLGWITVATIANVTAVLYDRRWDGWGLAPEVWTLLILAVALFLGALMVQRRGDIVFALVLAWAFAGIAVRHQATGLVFQGTVLATALALILALVGLLRLRRSPTRVMVDG